MTERPSRSPSSLDKKIIAALILIGALGLAANMMMFVEPATQHEKTALVVQAKGCDCCPETVDNLKAAGFGVLLKTDADLEPVLRQHKAPSDVKNVCQVVIAEDYAFLGKVPVVSIEQFLGAKPNARGLYAPPGPNEGKALLQFDAAGRLTPVVTP